jgi:hypothetical protein
MLVLVPVLGESPIHSGPMVSETRIEHYQGPIYLLIKYWWLCLLTLWSFEAMPAAQEEQLVSPKAAPPKKQPYLVKVLFLVDLAFFRAEPDVRNVVSAYNTIFEWQCMVVGSYRFLVIVRLLVFHQAIISKYVPWLFGGFRDIEIIGLIRPCFRSHCVIPPSCADIFASLRDDYCIMCATEEVMQRHLTLCKKPTEADLRMAEKDIIVAIIISIVRGNPYNDSHSCNSSWLWWLAISWQLFRIFKNFP